jgi:polysaccharide export outer membrane protein
VNIFEALAMAGDLTVWGLRDNVKLIREDANGKREIINLNLNNAGIVTCPYYYLQQNDILYVRPTKSKVYSNTFNSNTSMWTSLVSIALSVLSTCIIVYY